MRARTTAILLAILLNLALVRPALGQELETETARLKPGLLKTGANYELQLSSEGTEQTVPLFAELAVWRLELILEPVAYTAIGPKRGRGAKGIGDTELTALGLVLEERPWLPAVALAAEVKFPTARNELIGTREYDYRGILILSKRFSSVDVHLNGGYTILGQPPGTKVHNIFDFAVAARWYVTDRLDLFGEVLGDTTSSSEAESSTGEGTGAAAELAGGELSGTLGVGYRFVPSLLSFAGVSYDNNNAVLIHVGFQVESQLF